MPALTSPNKDLWLWLLHDGGAWTANDLALHLGRDVESLFGQLWHMARRGLVEKFPPDSGFLNIRYAVTGTCKVPQGLRLGEVQGD